MNGSVGLAAYLALSARSEWLARRVLRRRLSAGKEDASRIGERFGRSTIDRPEGQLVWFHSASVGEVVSLLALVRHLGEIRPDLTFLLTTGTVTSARILRTQIPPRTVHQFVPYDVLPAVKGFLDHWRPDVGIWTESELWPALICETHRRRVPLLYINARMSAGSFRRWRRLPAFARSILNRFEHALVQDDKTASQLRQLGLAEKRMEVLGSLKRDAAVLPCDEESRRQFVRALQGRRVWLAASTHEGEENHAAAAHLDLVHNDGGCLLIVVPRHPERGKRIARELRSNGFRVSLRSEAALPRLSDQIYIADTMGELGIWYRVAPVSFVGGSLVAAGGHNPYEPARLGCAIVHGPHVANFATEFGELADAGASVRVDAPEALAAAVRYALQPENAARLAAGASQVHAGGNHVTERAATVILEHLAPELSAA